MKKCKQMLKLIISVFYDQCYYYVINIHKATLWDRLGIFMC